MLLLIPCLLAPVIQHPFIHRFHLEKYHNHEIPRYLVNVMVAPTLQGGGRSSISRVLLRLTRTTMYVRGGHATWCGRVPTITVCNWHRQLFPLPVLLSPFSLFLASSGVCECGHCLSLTRDCELRTNMAAQMQKTDISLYCGLFNGLTK